MEPPPPETYRLHCEVIPKGIVVNLRVRFAREGGMQLQVFEPFAIEERRDQN